MQITEGPHFSCTQLITYLQCPLQYYYQYVLKLDWVKVPASYAFGSCMHKAIEAANLGLMNGGCKSSEIADIFFTHWEKEATEVQWDDELEKDALQTKGRMLTELYCATAKEYKPTEVELPFRLQIMDHDINILGDRDFVGRIDAIFTGDTIIEIKTSGRSLTQQEVDQNLQLTLYSWVYNKLYGQPEKGIRVINLVKTKTPKLTTLDTVRTERDHSWALAIVTQVIKAIDNEIFYPNPIGGYGCSSCPYRQHCLTDDDSEYNFINRLASEQPFQTPLTILS